MVNKTFPFAAVLLLVAFVLLLLTVISAPITSFSSLGSANDTKFGVFGYCFNNGTCSSVQIGYDSDDVLDSASTSAVSRRATTSSDDLIFLRKRQMSDSPAMQNPDSFNSPFNLPSDTRNSLAKILLVHVVAAGLTLLLLVMSVFGLRRNVAESSRFMLAWIILSVPMIVLTLLAFLVDILIFVPNLDWGTWITLAATVLNAVAGIMICTARRRLSTRKAMRARIAENDEMNGHTYYNAQHMQDPAPELRSMSDIDKATLPKFAQFEAGGQGADSERIPLNSLEPDNRSLRSDTPSRTSPPQYPVTSGAYGNTAYADQNPGSSPYGEPEYTRARIPYGNPPRQPAFRPRALTRERSTGQSSVSDMEVAPPLRHGDSAMTIPLAANAAEEADPHWPQSDDRFENDQGPVPEVPDAEWQNGPRRPPKGVFDAGSQQGRPGQEHQPRRQHPQQRGPSHGQRQRVVSGPRPMPESSPARQQTGPSYEDSPPQFEYGTQGPRNPEEEYMHNRLGPRRRTPRNSISYDRPSYPQPRSPDTLSVGSHFTSVSQRGINPQWRDEPQQSRMQESISQRSLPRAAPQDRRPPGPNILASNPDFVLPNVGAKKRLPASRRPGAIPGLSSPGGLGSGSSPYSITKGM